MHLEVRPSDELPVPTLDLELPDESVWAGMRSCFFLPASRGNVKGQLVVRNLGAPAPKEFTAEEYFCLVREHEVYHVLQALSGQDICLMADEDLSLCEGLVEALPVIGVRGRIPRDKAQEAGRRWFLQKFKTEIDAWNAVDFPTMKRKAREGKLDLESWRGEAMCAILRSLIGAVVWGFLEPYGISWREWSGSLAEDVRYLTRDTFLEQPVRCREGTCTPGSCLEGIDLSNGLIRNRRLCADIYAGLIAGMTRVGQVGVYDENNAVAQHFLAENSGPPLTLV